MRFNFSLVLVVLILGTNIAQSQLPYSQVLSKYSDFLIAQDTTSTAIVKRWVGSLQADGTWADVDYKDRNASSWKTTEHLDRLVKISIAYQKERVSRKKKATLDAIVKATVHWTTANYKNSNWWYNEIGVPQFWRDILTLNGELYDAQQRSSGLAILGQYKMKPNFTGANLTWSADLGLHYGLLTRNDTLIANAVKLLTNEIKISSSEGIRQDHSYQQHGARLQTHHYGAAFLKENIRLAYELQGSPWAFQFEKLALLKDFSTEGWQWMARGVYISPATIDRAVSRSGFLEQDISKLLPYFIKLFPVGKANDLQQMLDVQRGSKHNLNGFRYFPFSDFGAYQHPNFSFLLKTISTQTELAERINGENQKGVFLNLGNTYFIKNGHEYTDLMPFWNWNELPGTTNFKGALTIAKSNFVSGLSAGANGLDVMDLETFGADGKLTASKFWAVHNGKVFCLIAGIKLTGKADSIFTCMEQSRLQGEVLLNSANRKLNQNLPPVATVKWINHHEFTYVPLSPGKLSLNMQPVQGSWSSLSKSGSSAVTAERVFEVLFHHQNNSDAAYLVDGVTPVNQMQALLDKPSWQILENTKNCQAITFDDGVTMISFHQNGQLNYGKHRINVNKACLLIITKTDIYLSDPYKRGGDLEIVLDGKKIGIKLPADGKAVNQKI